jgi:hypothetical protein
MVHWIVTGEASGAGFEKLCIQNESHTMQLAAVWLNSIKLYGSWFPHLKTGNNNTCENLNDYTSKAPKNNPLLHLVLFSFTQLFFKTRFKSHLLSKTL